MLRGLIVAGAAASATAACITTFDAGADYFPAKAAPRHA